MSVDVLLVAAVAVFLAIMILLSAIATATWSARLLADRAKRMNRSGCRLGADSRGPNEFALDGAPLAGSGTTGVPDCLALDIECVR